MKRKIATTGWRRLGIGLAAGLAAFGISGGATAKTQLLVYTAVEADELKMFKQAFEKDYPDIQINWVRDSTGIITAKLLAEKANPKADIVWGVAATSLVLLANEGYFQPYAPKGLKGLDQAYVDPKNSPPLWVGQRAWIASVCYNTVEAKKHNLPMPTSWKDLTKSVYQGHVIMPNPNSSGTGFLDVSSWLQMWGEKDAWGFMDALHNNIARYTHSGSKPCKLAARGEIPIGVSFAYRGAKSKNKGAPLEVIAPSEGVGWDLESFGIVRNTKNLAAARALADWSVTRKANEIYNREYAVVAMPGVAKPVKNFPPKINEKMIKNDFAWAAANRQRILKEWQKRYDAKSEPKK
ncbi:MAG: putative 2-aminoethylphosphonate ABC transporter substrate-binding protein [Alphaproteobacteria bacterium]|jgi:iron(III) transport system substrate-binding protein|nr:putative 2-aminoethylphosphonate ABC transporter substrate-binding protein [Alphaproteobacteria bacterium]